MGPISRMKQFLRYAFRGPSERVAGEQPWWAHDKPPWPSQSNEGPRIQRVVDNRVMLLGLDELYRTAMKGHERTELLACAQRVSTALHQAPADVPVEGYYSEDSALTTYFRLMRTLQTVSLERAPEVEAIPEFHRLLTVTSSPIFGSPVRENLLPTGRDPLSAALLAIDLAQWSVPLLTAEAAKAARAADDFSLVGLAARAEDPVVLAALRESVVLYAMVVTGGFAAPRFEYVWQVDPALAAAAQHFVDGFNGLFGSELPPPTAQYAHIFGDAFGGAEVVGRCVRLGQTADRPVHYYHWAVCRDSEDQLAVHEFWHDQVVTTKRYRRSACSAGARYSAGGCWSGGRY